MSQTKVNTTSKKRYSGPAPGAALYRKEMLDEIGLFDEDFFLYMEDVDLAFRGRLAGWKCIYDGNRNVIWYVIKDFPPRLLITSLPFILARNLALIPYDALRGQGRGLSLNRSWMLCWALQRC